ncbi:MAG: Spy/CpxP family protein refolding chaperone [Acidobacteria bacterium]|nr:Spy/CpxP family protein refolding chaperone [Acidobacteriota bacterium]
MKTKKMMLMGAALIAVLAMTGFRMDAGASVACAQQGPPPGQRGPGGPGGPGGQGGGDRMFERLNLTEAQKQKIESLRERQHADAEQYHEQLQSLHEQMRAIVEAGTFNEAAARSLLAKEAQIEVELKLLRIRTDNAIHNTLTAEQKTKQDDLRRNQRRSGYDN